jgi:hypothetical protein
MPTPIRPSELGINRTGSNANQSPGDRITQTRNPGLGFGFDGIGGNPIQSSSNNRAARNGESTPIPPTMRNTIALAGDPNGILAGDENEAIANSILHTHTLDDYVSSKYNIRLSLVGDSNTVTTTHSELSDIDNLFFLASSDISGADESYGDNKSPSQFFIKSLNFKTINSMTVNNPETPNSAMFTMQVEEPYGFSFDRRVRQAATALGYSRNFPPSRMIFRMDIWFSGYRGDGVFVEKVPVPNPYPNLTVSELSSRSYASTSVPISGDIEGENPDYGSARVDTVVEVDGSYQNVETFTYFVNIIQVKSKLDNGSSTNYELSMIPVHDLVMYPEYDTLHYFDIELGGEAEANNTFGGYIDELQNKLNDAFTTSVEIGEPGYRMDSAEQIAVRRYEFHVDSDLVDAPFDQLPEDTSDEDRVALTRLGNIGSSIRGDIMEKITRTSEGRRRLIGDDNGNIEYPRDIYVIRTRIDYSESSEEYIDQFGDLTGIVIHYYIEKKREYRYTPSNYSEFRNWSEDAEERAREIIQSGALKKIYKYVYTGDNTVVKNFSIDANIFWHSIRSSPSNDYRYNSTSESIDDAQQDLTTPRISLFPNSVVQSALNEIYSNSETVQDENIFPYRQTFSPFRYMMAQSNSVDETTPNEELEGYSLYQQELERALRTQSVTLENLEIRGDPQWLASIYSLDDPQANLSDAQLNLALTTDVIYLKLLYPEQTEYMNPNIDYNNSQLKSANYGGFFQVISVEHKFEGGDYSQSFVGHRLTQELTRSGGVSGS